MRDEKFKLKKLRDDIALYPSLTLTITYYVLYCAEVKIVLIQSLISIPRPHPQIDYYSHTEL